MLPLPHFKRAFSFLFFCFFFNLYSITLSRSLSTQGDGRHSRKGFFLLSSDHLQSPPIIPFFSFLNLCSFNLSSFMRLLKYFSFPMVFSSFFFWITTFFSSPILSSITSHLFKFHFSNGVFLPFSDYHLHFLFHPSHQSPTGYPSFISLMVFPSFPIHAPFLFPYGAHGISCKTNKKFNGREKYK